MGIVIYVHLMDISQGWSINYVNNTCVCVCKRMGWEVVILRDLFYSVGYEHDVNCVETGVNIALVLTRIKFSFFIVACMVLCFGSVIKTVDKTEMFELFLKSADTESKASLALTRPHQ